MAYSAKILADNLAPSGKRIVTYEVTFPRIVLAEFNTHRQFCLAGDSELEFELPTGKTRRVYRMRLSDFADKWFGGARRIKANPKKTYDLSWVQPEVSYDPWEIAVKMGMANPGAINIACRDGRLPAIKNGRQWVVRGEDLIAWRASAPEHTRFDIRARLSGMRIRQLNEKTGRIQTSTVVDVYRSGEKEVFEVVAGKHHVAGSKDHRVLTMDGWKTIGDLTLDDHLIIRKFGKEAKDKFGARFSRIDGVWQGGTYLYGAPVKVKSIKSRGVEQTYDLEIAGDFPNFLANGVVVHNSRNSASSRAIPVEKMLTRVEEDPFIPVYWGKNQKGMQADSELTESEQDKARFAWLAAKGRAVDWAKTLLDLGVHKQVTNRLLEPFLWQTVIVTATEFDNFFALRTHRDAQPEIREIALRMEKLYDEHEPLEVEEGFWHLPLVEDRAELEAAGYTLDDIKRISVGRCARVSYLTHDGRRDPKADLELCERLRASGHMSPFEHVAQALSERIVSGNLIGWHQYRKGLTGEAIYQPVEA